MRKIVLMLVIALLPIAAKAQNGFIGRELQFTDDGVALSYQISILSDSDGNLSWFAWSFVSKHWSEMYSGLSYSPADWFQFGVGLGIETADNPLRYGGFLWAGKEKFSVLVLGEDGGSGWWHRIVANYQLTNRLGVGVFNQYLIGLGPRVQVEIYKFELWGTATYTNNTQSSNAITGLIGLQLLF